MKWAYQIGPRLRIAALLGLVLVGVFCKNLLERKNVATLGQSFSSVYEDRLLVESYIYKMSDQLYRKQLMLEQWNGTSAERQSMGKQLASFDAAIGRLMQDYRKTKFTAAEEEAFAAFVQQYKHLQAAEQTWLQAGDESIALKAMAACKQPFDQASATLHQLSAIQVAEGKLLNDQSKRIMAGSTILTSFEMALLICIAIIIQILLFTAKTLIPKQTSPAILN
jgi:paraquat-inducible protein B